MKTFNLILTLVVCGLLTGSCAKEGCTDSDSINYDAKAKKDDGTCRYEGKVVFWFDANASQYFINEGTTQLTYKIDDKIVDSEPTNIYWTSSPSCGQDGSATATLDLGGSLVHHFAYTVEDQNGAVLISGSVGVEANACKRIKVR